MPEPISERITARGPPPYKVPPSVNPSAVLNVTTLPPVDARTAVVAVATGRSVGGGVGRAVASALGSSVTSGVGSAGSGGTVEVGLTFAGEAHAASRHTSTQSEMRRRR